MHTLWKDDSGQDIVVGTVRLIGTNANNVFSSVASAVQ